MNIAFLTKSWPRHNYNGHYEQTISLIETLINLTHEICVCTDETNLELKEEIKNYPMKLMDINGKKISQSLNGFGKNQFRPGLFVFDGIQSEEKYSAFVYNRWNKCPRILMINQLQKLSKWRKSNYRLTPNVLVPQNAPIVPQKKQQIFSIEQIRAINRSDYIFAGNSFIYHLLNKHIFQEKQNLGMNTRQMTLINYGFPIEEYLSEINELEFRPFRNRQNFVFIGNFDRESSIDCVFTLCSFIWPSIQKELPEAELHIYGTFNNQPVTMNKLFSKLPQLSKEQFSSLKIRVKGKMQDTTELSSYKSMLYPTCFSTSTHFKVIESWFNHLPVVTTPIGAQGLFLEPVDPQFVSSKELSGNAFTMERVYTQQQKNKSQNVKNYYNGNSFNRNIQLTFGGSYLNFTYKDFIQSSIQMYKDEQTWKKALQNCHKIIRKNHNEQQLDIVLKRALVNVQMAAYEGRGKPEYEQEWRRYSKSQEFVKKVRN